MKGIFDAISDDGVSCVGSAVEPGRDVIVA